MSGRSASPEIISGEDKYEYCVYKAIIAKNAKNTLRTQKLIFKLGALCEFSAISALKKIYFKSYHPVQPAISFFPAGRLPVPD